MLGDSGYSVAEIVGQILEYKARIRRFQWDGRDENDLLLPPGIYILDAKVETNTRTERRQRVVHVVY